MRNTSTQDAKRRKKSHEPDAELKTEEIKDDMKDKRPVASNPTKSAFTFFRKLNQAELEQETKGMSVLDSAIYVGGKWQTLSCKEKNVYIAMELEDKIKLENGDPLRKPYGPRRTALLNAPVLNRSAFTVYCDEHPNDEDATLEAEWENLLSKERDVYERRAEFEELTFKESKRRLFERMDQFQSDDLYSSLLYKPDTPDITPPEAIRSAFYYFCREKWNETSLGPVMNCELPVLENFIIEWNEMSGEQRKPYMELEVQDALRFEQDVHSYVSKHQSMERMNSSIC